MLAYFFAKKWANWNSYIEIVWPSWLRINKVLPKWKRHMGNVSNIKSYPFTGLWIKIRKVLSL